MHLFKCVGFLQVDLDRNRITVTSEAPPLPDDSGSGAYPSGSGSTDDGWLKNKGAAASATGLTAEEPSSDISRSSSAVIEPVEEDDGSGTAAEAAPTSGNSGGRYRSVTFSNDDPASSPPPTSATSLHAASGGASSASGGFGSSGRSAPPPPSASSGGISGGGSHQHIHAPSGPPLDDVLPPLPDKQRRKLMRALALHAGELRRRRNMTRRISRIC